jgi:pimeloyl-ACP methyl ester carboxylesterase
VTAKRAILVCLGVVAAAILLSTISHRVAAERRQDALDAFYATPADVAAIAPGAVIRREPLPSLQISGAQTYRLLYRTERGDGSAAVSGAIAIVPTAPPPGAGRPVLVWAHGTVGLGRGCAPSRRVHPLSSAPWIGDAVANGFVVIAPDYAGLGTAGPSEYLIGRAEALDITNAVRALDGVPDAAPERRWAVIGHSQGGHAALWSAPLAPELLAVGAPAANLAAIVNEQWDAGIGCVIGAAIASSWPSAYPEADLTGDISRLGRLYAGPVADACLGEGIPVPPILGFLAAGVGLPFFDRNPDTDPRIAALVAEQTPQPLPATLPLLIAQGTADSVVPPDTNAALQVDWCAAGSNLTMDWLGGVGHVAAGPIVGTLGVPWLRAIFDGARPRPQCDFVPPVPAAGSMIREVTRIGS